MEKTSHGQKKNPSPEFHREFSSDEGSSGSTTQAGGEGGDGDHEGQIDQYAQEGQAGGASAAEEKDGAQTGTVTGRFPTPPEIQRVPSTGLPSPPRPLILNTDLSDMEQRIAEHYLRDDPER